MDGSGSVFEHRTYPLPHSHRAGAALAKQQHATSPVVGGGGYLSPSSTTLVAPDSLGDAVSPSRPTGDLYCRVCKRRYGSAATLEAHFGSERHRKAVAASAGSPTRPRGQVTAAADGSLKSMDKALRIAGRDPAVAAVVLWGVAKDLAPDARHRASLQRALEATQGCLRAMDADPGLRGGPAAAWTARSLLKTALECDLALARLLAAEAPACAAAAAYADAVARYMGIAPGALDSVARLRAPQPMAEAASRLAAAVPRKFARQEDVAQALAAMEEAASAQLAFAAGDQALAQRGLAVLFVRRAFALDKARPADALQTLLAAADAYRWLGADHYANDCAVLLVAHHLDQPMTRRLVAAAAVASIRAADLVRARALLECYAASAAPDEPWVRFLVELVARLVCADTAWLSGSARAEWDAVRASCPAADCPVYELVEALLASLLEPYSWYTPPP